MITIKPSYKRLIGGESFTWSSCKFLSVRWMLKIWPASSQVHKTMQISKYNCSVQFYNWGKYVVHFYSFSKYKKHYFLKIVYKRHFSTDESFDKKQQYNMFCLGQHWAITTSGDGLTWTGQKRERGISQSDSLDVWFAAIVYNMSLSYHICHL